MTTSLWKRMRYSSARRVTNTTASGSSAFTWKIGASSIFATSLQYMVLRASCGIRDGEADLVVHDHVNRATRIEAAGLRQLHGLHDHALPGERRVTVHHHRHDSIALRVAATLLTGAHGAFDHRIHHFEVRRVEGEHDVHVARRRAQVGRETLVILHVAGRAPSYRLASYLPSNSENSTDGDLPRMFTSTLRRPRWAMPMTTSSTPATPQRWMRSSTSGISESPPSSEKRFWPTYLVWR